MSEITRRSAIWSLAALSGGLLHGREKATAFALIGDRYHNSDYIRTGLTRNIAKDLGVSIDFCDETTMLTAETLHGYKLLIILRDGMNWPDGYPDETTNAAWVNGGKTKLVFRSSRAAHRGQQSSIQTFERGDPCSRGCSKRLPKHFDKSAGLAIPDRIGDLLHCVS